MSQIKLEIGKTYLRGNLNEVVIITMKNTNQFSKYRYFDQNGCAYAENGESYHDSDIHSEYKGK